MNRSPMGEVLLRERLRELGVDARVSSAGTRATLGAAAPEVCDLLAERGLDATSHLSRQLTPEMVAEADLVLAMAREHVREAVVAAPEAFVRCYTLPELVRRAREVGPRGPDEDLRGWLARVGEDRTPRDLLGASDDDDVPDPIGQKRAAFERAHDQIAELVEQLALLIAGRPVLPG